MRLLAAAMLALSFSTAAATMADAAPNVVTTIKPVHSLVSAVMKGVGEPAILVDGAASPHGYALKPSQAAALQDADVVFWIGPELETFLEKPIETIAGKAESVALIDVDGVKTLAPREGGAFEADDHGEEEGHDHGHGHGEEVDGHVWLDPENAKAFVAAIAAALERADPANAAAYSANASAETAKLDALIAATREKLKPVAGKGFLVFHDAYHYYEARFGVEAAGSITVNPEVAPGAERIAELQAKLKELGAACIFAEPQFEPKLVATIIEGTSARSGTLDPLGASLDNGPDLYHQLIDGLTASLTGCLSGAS